jgi:hypothetical protein
MPCGVRYDALAVGLSRPDGSWIEGLLYELCVGLGDCLPPAEEEALRDSPPETVDEFTDAVLLIQGFDPTLEKDHRRSVHECVSKWFERRAPAPN